LVVGFDVNVDVCICVGDGVDIVYTGFWIVYDFFVLVDAYFFVWGVGAGSV